MVKQRRKRSAAARSGRRGASVPLTPPTAEEYVRSSLHQWRFASDKALTEPEEWLSPVLSRGRRAAIHPDDRADLTLYASALRKVLGDLTRALDRNDTWVAARLALNGASLYEELTRLPRQRRRKVDPPPDAPMWVRFEGSKQLHANDTTEEDARFGAKEILSSYESDIRARLKNLESQQPGQGDEAQRQWRLQRISARNALEHLLLVKRSLRAGRNWNALYRTILVGIDEGIAQVSPSVDNAVRAQRTAEEKLERTAGDRARDSHPRRSYWPPDTETWLRTRHRHWRDLYPTPEPMSLVVRLIRADINELARQTNKKPPSEKQVARELYRLGLEQPRVQART